MTTDSRARRNVIVLVSAQAILGAQMPISFVLGGLSGQMLSPVACFATLPISLIVLTTMFAAPILSEYMQRHGRRAGFVIGAAGGAAGGALGAAGLLLGSFPLFLLASIGTGIYMAAQGFYRFAATDTASDAFRAKAISYVMAGGLLSAVIGPQLVKLSGDWTDPIPFAGGYLAIVGLNLLGVLVFRFLDIPRPPAPAIDAPAGRSRMELLRSPRIAVAMICAMVSYALMNLVMTSTPLAVVGCGFTTDNAADIVSAHVLAMFAPSFFTGHLIARFGVERVIAAGLVLLAAAGLVAIAGVELLNFYAALILLGLGWNFGYIGATAMLSGAHSPEERGRVQGMNDAAVFGMVTIASFASGLLSNCAGTDAVEGWTLVNIAMIPFLTLAGGVLLWFTLRGRAVRSAR
ncbi:MFS transporter [Halovulum dunhuangense]|uniref:MFS transporter n=1 Tax=Halovulum dunhuangense TaxID=1505036 RepID=A0A849L436_9RHOB|nr:MFS transporter [Halovulum dunhuangense]NNU80964.1 MFS transporter [Halovulum dunhuangense]